MREIAKLLFGHPLVKAIGLGLFGLLGNVLAGAYVFEITRSSGGEQFIDWRASPQSPSFWGLAAVLLLMGLYGWGMARFETRARKALTEAEIRERVLRELLDPLIAAVRKRVEEGRVTTLDQVLTTFGLGKEKRDGHGIHDRGGGSDTPDRGADG